MHYEKLLLAALFSGFQPCNCLVFWLVQVDKFGLPSCPSTWSFFVSFFGTREKHEMWSGRSRSCLDTLRPIFLHLSLASSSDRRMCLSVSVWPFFLVYRRFFALLWKWPFFGIFSSAGLVMWPWEEKSGKFRDSFSAHERAFFEDLAALPWHPIAQFKYSRSLGNTTC